MDTTVRCVRCLEAVATDGAARYLTFVRRAGGADALPTNLVACAACAPAITELTDGWTPGLFERACSFCDRGAAAATATILDGGVVTDGVEAGLPAYVLCPPCTDVFATFLRDTRRDALRGGVSASWDVSADGAGDARCEFRNGERRVFVTAEKRDGATPPTYAVWIENGERQRLGEAESMADALDRCRAVVAAEADPAVAAHQR